MNVTNTIALLARMKRQADDWQNMAARELMFGNVDAYNRYTENANRIRYSMKAIRKNLDEKGA